MADSWDRLGQWLHLGEEPQPAAGTEVAPRVDPSLPQTHGAPCLGGKVMHRVPGQWVDVCHTCHTGQDSGGPTTLPAGMSPCQSSPRRARSSCSMLSPGCRTTRLPAWMAMVCPTSRAGVGQDLVSTVLIPREIKDTQGWCRVMAYI